jgi:hypothetical protein
VRRARRADARLLHRRLRDDPAADDDPRTARPCSRHRARRVDRAGCDVLPQAGKRALGRRVKITVTDRSAADGFRLAGPGVTRATGVKFKGSVTWAVRLKPGKYSFGSLRNAKRRRSITISS